MDIKIDVHQLKAVRHLEGPALVIAGPGSGKTTVIKERILNLIREHNVEPERIPAINEIKKEKHATSPTTQEVNKNLGHYLRQIYNFVKGIPNQK